MTPRFACVLRGGPVQMIQVGAESVLFEMHPRFGPMPIDKRTHQERALGPRHKFWRAATLWDAQGRRVGPASRDGVKPCVWDDVPL